MNNKVFFFMVMFILAAFLGNIQGVCLAQPADNTKINKRDSSPTELTADQQGQTEESLKQDNRTYHKSVAKNLNWPTYWRIGLEHAAYKILTDENNRILGVISCPTRPRG